MHRRIYLTILLCMCLIFTLVSYAYAAGFSDVQGHWAESQINKWTAKGLASGYSDNTFRPNKLVTRAEFVALVNRAFNFKKDITVAGFSDVKPDKWYCQEVSSAQAAGYISGYNDGTFKPDQTITRQEVAVILVRLLNLEPITKGVSQFADTGQFAEWATGNIGAVVKNGLMRGMPGKTFQPLKGVTRAEAVVSLHRALGVLAQAGRQAAVNSGIEGVVTRDENVVENATIRVSEADSCEVLKEVRTNDRGNYKVALEAGDYDITATIDKEVAYESNIKVTDSNITNANLVLEKAAVISGTLKDKYGRAVKNTTLLFTTNPTFIATTNNSGKYTTLVLPDRTYTVRTYNPNNKDKAPETISSSFGVGAAGPQEMDELRTSFSVSVASGGGGSSSSGSENDNPETVANVSNVSEFNSALNNSNIKTIKLSANIKGNINVNRLVENINFVGYQLDGNMTIKATSRGIVNLNGTGKPSITGDLMVDTPNITVKNGVIVGGTIYIRDVASHSWDEEADGNAIDVQDGDASIHIKGYVRSLTVTSGGDNLIITIDDGKTVESFEINAQAEIVINGFVNSANINAPVAVRNAQNILNAIVNYAGGVELDKVPQAISLAEGIPGVTIGGYLRNETWIANLNAVRTTRQNLSLGVINLKAITENITLPTRDTQNGTTIDWKTSDADVITNNGIIIRPAPGGPDAAATLTATITKGDVSLEKKFKVTVKAQESAVVIPVTGVTLDQATMTLTVGGASKTLTAAVTPVNATNKVVTWSSDNESVAKVVYGEVTPEGEGTAIITVTTEDGGYTDTCEVKVNAAKPTVIPVTGVTLDQATMTLTAGGASKTLTAAVTPVNATNKTVTWSSDNESVAKVVYGEVTPEGEGTAIITVTTEDGGYTDTCDITVNSATGNIAGKVASVVNGDPIGGATVSLTIDAKLYSSVTDAVYGAYTITDVPAGNDYTISASADDYQTLSVSGVDVTAGKTTNKVNFSLLLNKTEATQAGDITLTNNAVGDDSISVANVAADAVVRVYDAADGGNIIGTVTQGGATGTVTIIIAGGFQAGLNNIYVTVEDLGAGTTESFRTAIAIPARAGDISATITPSAGSADGDTNLSIANLNGVKLWLNPVADADASAPLVNSARVPTTYSLDITSTGDYTLGAGVFDVVEVDVSDKVIGFSSIIITDNQVAQGNGTSGDPFSINTSGEAMTISVDSNFLENYFSFNVEAGKVYKIEIFDENGISGSGFYFTGSDGYRYTNNIEDIQTWLCPISGIAKIRIDNTGHLIADSGSYKIKVTIVSTPITADGTQFEGNIAQSQEEDWYELDALPGTYTVKVDSTSNLYVTVRDAYAQLAMFNNSVVWTCDSAGKYFIQLNMNHRYSGSYQLSVIFNK